MRFKLFDAAAWTTVIFYVLNYIVIVYVFARKTMIKYSYGFCANAAGILMMIQPISWFAIKFEAVSGRALINTWHNPTNIVARGLGVIAIYLLIAIVNDWENQKQYPIKLYIAFGITLVLTNLGKPSFSQVFVPAIAIYFIGYCLYNKFSNFFSVCFWHCL